MKKEQGIYILTNTVNGKQYVGMDSNLPSRAHRHLSGNTKECRLIHRAIQKYGKDTFSIETIPCPDISHDALCALEQAKIAELNTKAPHGYNLTDGGEGSVNPSLETRQKVSEALKGHEVTLETRQKISEANQNPSPETRLKMSDAQNGRKHTLESRQKMSKSRQGEKHHYYGKTFSIEHRQKISEAAKKQHARQRAERDKLSGQRLLF